MPFWEAWINENIFYWNTFLPPEIEIAQIVHIEYILVAMIYETVADDVEDRRTKVLENPHRGMR